MTAIFLPPNPTTGQEYVATNGVTYIWLGDRWNTTEPIRNQTAAFYYEGGDSTTWLDTQTFPPDTVLDGGNSFGLADVQHVIINSVQDIIWGYLRVTYTLTGTNGQGYSEMGVIIGHNSVDRARAGETCSGTPSTNGAYAWPMRQDLGLTADCGYGILTNINDGIFQQDIPVWSFSNTDTNVVAYTIDSGGHVYYSQVERVHIPFIPCFAEGTLVTMADGSHKAIEHITYNDSLRVWDFDLGESSSALPLWIKRPQKSMMFNRSHFADGTVLDTMQYVKGHRVFNLTQNKFVFIMDCKPGDRIIKDGGETEFVKWEIVQSPITYYNIITQHHMNMYANNVLTSTGFNNLYLFKDMKFVKEPRTPRSYHNIDPMWVKGLRLAENTTVDVEGMAQHLDQLQKLTAK